MKRNRVIFYILVAFALVLCIAGVVRYDRNEEKVVLSAYQTRVANTNDTAYYGVEQPFFDNYAEAAIVAQDQEKPILMLFTAKNCVYSKQMVETTFQEDAVRPFLQRFVLVNIDINRQKDVCRWLNVGATPTIQFLSSQGYPLQRINGVTRSADLIARMNLALQTIASHPGNAVVR